MNHTSKQIHTDESDIKTDSHNQNWIGDSNRWHNCTKNSTV